MPCTKTAYPVGADVQRFLYETGLVTAAVTSTTLSGPVSAGTNVSLGLSASLTVQLGDVIAIDAGENCELATVNQITTQTNIRVATLQSNHIAGVAVTLTLLGRPPLNGAHWESAIDSAIDSFEESVSRKMLATVDSTRLLDPPEQPKKILRLDDDLCAVTSVSVAGVLKTRDTDYRLLPRNEDSRNRPFSMIEFLTVPQSMWAQISITGKWGRATCLPDDAFGAMIRIAATRLIPFIAANISQGLTSWRESDVQEDYGQEPLNWLREAWDDYLYGDGKTHFGVVGKYKRVTVGT